jgi:hypothetical protein
MNKNCNFYISKQDISVHGCNCKIHSGLCEHIDYCYYKQLQTLKADNDRITKALEEIKDPPCRVDCKPDDCDSAAGCSYLIKKALQEGQG